MRRTRPLTETDDFQRDGSIEAFLARPINNPLTTAPELFEQLVIAKLHLDSTRFRSTIVLLIKQTKTGSEQTHAAQSAWRIGKNRSAAFCANAALSCGVGAHWIRIRLINGTVILSEAKHLWLFPRIQK